MVDSDSRDTAVDLLEGFVQELEIDLGIIKEWQEGIVMPEQSHAQEIRVYERVIGEEEESSQ